MWVWCLVPFSCIGYSLFLSSWEMLSRTRKPFLEAGSGFCGNAFRSWGETQPHGLWNCWGELPCLELNGQNLFPEQKAWSECSEQTQSSGKKKKRAQHEAVKWCNCSCAPRQAGQCDPAHALAAVSNTALLPCVCESCSCLISNCTD